MAHHSFYISKIMCTTYGKVAFLLIFSFACTIPAASQSWLERMGQKVKDRVVEKVEERVEQKTDEAVEAGLDKTEKELKGSTSSEQTAATPQNRPGDRVSYAKYDFVPGDVIIFEDDLAGEKMGEFPSRWDLLDGNAEVAQVNGANVIALVGYTYITPLFKEGAGILPTAFTLEFDFFIDGKNGEQAVEFVNAQDETVASTLFWKDNSRFIFNWNITEQERDSEESFDNSPGWHHYALSFNKRAVKIYIDAKRVTNVPNITQPWSKVKFFARGEEDNSTFHIKNIKIARGGVPLYDRLATDGKIVTYGITFDVGKSLIKPQSTGTLNEIAALMRAHPALRFTVEGHTDNTGTAQSNQALSQERAVAVCRWLQQAGIDESRLVPRGFGMSRPAGDNATPEGRAVNRRVEFVKL